MSDNLNLGDGCCCRPSVSGYRMLTFPDGLKIGIYGLDAVLEDLYQQGKPADLNTSLELMERLKGQNYFAPSAKQTYQRLFLSEYQSFLEMRLLSKEKENKTMSDQEKKQETRKKGIFSLFKNDKKAASECGCCNMKIIPQEQAAKESSKGGCCNMKIVPKEQAAQNKDTK